MGRRGNKQIKDYEEMVEKNHDDADPLSLVIRLIVVHLAKVIPESLLGDVGVPDQEVLGERYVGPENGEGQHQHADAVEGVRVEDALVVTSVPEPHHDDDPDGECSTHAVGEEPHAVHRRKPMILEGFDPVDRREGERERP